MGGLIFSAGISAEPIGVRRPFWIFDIALGPKRPKQNRVIKKNQKNCQEPAFHPLHFVAETTVRIGVW
ncbi:MAG: hypothetical protein P4L43_12070, partial [Syntrophobacteraceae bacterium]|nr:hypothetical protein [Syntrophobacteraceae bacterium]